MINAIPQLDNEREHALKLIEESPIHYDQRLDLAYLLLERNRRAAHIGDGRGIEGRSKDEKERVRSKFDLDFKEIIWLLERINKKIYFPFEVYKKPQELDGAYGYSIHVAKDSESLLELREVDEKNDDKAYGHLMGYPSSAVAAYGTSRAIDMRTDLPREEFETLMHEHLLPFMQFSFSRAHWKEELEFVRNRQRLIQKHCPRLYAEVIAEDIRGGDQTEVFLHPLIEED